MRLAHFLVTGIIRVLIDILCRVHAEELAKVPKKGPLILVGNHVNFLEVPVGYTYLPGRPLTGLAKSTTWKNPFFRVLFNTWGGIPLKRGEADFAAYEKAQQALADGKIVAMAPEGTRSGTGKLQQGYPGVVLLAVRSGAPLLPMVFWGGEKFWGNLKRLKRTDFYFRVGRPFHIETGGAALARDVRNQITREVMYQLAALLPPEFRGLYSDLENATGDYLRFDEGEASAIPTSAKPGRQKAPAPGPSQA
jgi:1-acyl-sn-glycerol-3-phosphate acyltransferase